jgi:hypothetical protein
MRKAGVDTWSRYAKDLLEAMATEKGWKIVSEEERSPMAYAEIWLNECAGISLSIYGHPTAAPGRKLIARVIWAGRPRQGQAKAWRRLVGIEEEDRRSILELAASLQQCDKIVDKST